MHGADSRRQELERDALLLSARVNAVEDALRTLRRLASLLFEHARPESEAIDEWLAQQGFARVEGGLYERPWLLERIQAGDAPEGAVAYAWSFARRYDLVLRARLFLLRELGPDLHDIQRRLGKDVRIRYRDVRDAALHYPPAGIEALLAEDPEGPVPPRPPTGSQRHPRLVRWRRLAPAEDGAEPSAIASILVERDEQVLGRFSVEAPLSVLLGPAMRTTRAGSALHLIVDAAGRLVVPPKADARERGKLAATLLDLGPELGAIDPARCIAAGRGELPLRGGRGGERLCLFQAVPDVGLLLLSILPEGARAGAPTSRPREEGLAREAEERGARLEASEAMFRAVSRSAADAIISADDAGFIMFWNPSAERLFGWTEREITGRSVETLIPERYRTRHREAMARIAMGQPPRLTGKTIELGGLRKDGKEVPIELSLTTWKLSGRTYFTSIVRDISERKKAEQKLLAYNGELAKKNEELTRSREELMRRYRQVERLFAAYAEALPGAIIDGKYRLDAMLGAGGFGVVYRATHLGLERSVAIKVFRPPGAQVDPSHLGRFQMEGISACRVQHPNAVAVLDFGISSGGIPYLVMELLAGRTLAEDLRRRGRMPARRALEIALCVARVLSVAHAAGIVHRDIKPDNVYLHREGSAEVVKVLDFGIAKLVGNDAPLGSALTATGEMLGTPVYMAPERIQGERVDGRSDVYSLGVLLHEMLTGSPPFSGGEEGAWRVMAQHLMQDPVPLRALDPRIPEPLEALVLATLSKRVTARPTAAELAAKLERMMLAVAPGWLDPGTSLMALGATEADEDQPPPSPGEPLSATESGPQPVVPPAPSDTLPSRPERDAAVPTKRS